MAEIATEDPPPEEEENAGDQVSEEQKTEREEAKQQEEEQQQEDEEEEEESKKPSEIRDEDEQTSATQDDSDSDSDTDDEYNSEDEERKTVAQVSTLTQTPPPVKTTVSACHTPPIIVPSSTPEIANVTSGVRVTEASVSSGTPSSPGRCISVSSPGRGHKIFMVTRVESPLEQQQSDLTNKTPSVSASSKQQPFSQDQQSAERSTSAQETSEEVSQVSAGSKPGETEPSLSTIEEQPSTLSQMQQEANPSTEPDKEATREEAVHTEHAQIHHTAPTESEELFQDQLKPAEEVHEEPSSSNLTGDLQEELTKHLDTETPNNDQHLDKDASLEQDSETVNSFYSSEEVKSLDTAPSSGTTLPNGLKPEFTKHLLEPEAHKAACCVMEHSEFTLLNIAALMRTFMAFLNNIYS